MVKHRLIKTMCLLLLTAVLLAGCGNEKPAAVLHKENDLGYIPCVAEQADIEIDSSQAFVYDINESKYIYKKGSDVVVYPASTTKLLTILYALVLLDPSETVTPGNELELVGANSSVAYIKTFHTLSVEMLIEGMLLPSGNDAAYALAAAAGRKLNKSEGVIDGKKAVELFINGMNSYAKSLGLCGSNFTSPDGYYNDNHYTTVEDITIVAALASQNDIIMKYTGMTSDDVTYASGHTNHWDNTNLLLERSGAYYCEYVTGLKTGSAGTGNYSLICTVDFKDGRQYIIGIFSAVNKNDRYTDALKIIGYLS